MMKSRYGTLAVVLVLLVVCVLPVRNAASEPTYRFGFKAGLGMGKLTGDDTGGVVSIGEGFDASISGDVDNYRMGFTGGIYALVQITDLFGVRLEALYAMKGGKGNVSGMIDVDPYGVVPFDVETIFKLDYFEMPLLAVLTVPLNESVRFDVMAGVALSFNVKAKLTLDGSILGFPFKETEDIDELVTGTDLGGVIGGGITFDAGRVDLFVDGRWTFGFSSIDDTGEELDIKNSALSFAAGVGIPFGAGE